MKVIAGSAECVCVDCLPGVIGLRYFDIVFHVDDNPHLHSMIRLSLRKAPLNKSEIAIVAAVTMKRAKIFY